MNWAGVASSPASVRLAANENDRSLAFAIASVFWRLRGSEHISALKPSNNQTYLRRRANT